jgi:beta-lactamase class D
VNSIIALETSIVENENTIFRWDGKERYLKLWEQDLTFSDALKYSCVPCYQEIAKKIGSKRMNNYLQKLNYGEMVVNSFNIDKFWLEGNSQISQFQQIDFLIRLYKSKLPISLKTETIIKKMLVLKETSNYKLSGKTGWSIRNNNNNGWFVGYLEKNDQVFFFATNINPQNSFDMKMFSLIRKKITMKAFKALQIVN